MRKAIVGCLLGTAVGDAVGLPYENLAPRRAERLLGTPDRHRFHKGRGMVSDDTEHACLVAQAMIETGDDLDAFQAALARRLRWWLLGLPAGLGWATCRAGVRLWLGFSPHTSGVFSAGNGPAMRAAVLGAAIDDDDRLQRWIRASTRITHTDPKAEYGALAVALAAQQARRGNASPERFLERLRQAFAGRTDGQTAELVGLLERVAASVHRGDATCDFAAAQGWKRGVTGYMYQTVPAALHAWLRHPHDLRSAVVDMVRCGGDADSTAAIVGGVVGAGLGKEGVPRDWLDGLQEPLRTVPWMEQLGEQLADACKSQRVGRPAELPLFGECRRNLVFLFRVLRLAARRLLPPY